MNEEEPRMIYLRNNVLLRKIEAHLNIISTILTVCAAIYGSRVIGELIATGFLLAQR